VVKNKINDTIVPLNMNSKNIDKAMLTLLILISSKISFEEFNKPLTGNSLAKPLTNL
jgi:hypothetical protein